MMKLEDFLELLKVIAKRNDYSVDILFDNSFYVEFKIDNDSDEKFMVTFMFHTDEDDMEDPEKLDVCLSHGKCTLFDADNFYKFDEKSNKELESFLQDVKSKYKSAVETDIDSLLKYIESNKNS